MRDEEFKASIERGIARSRAINKEVNDKFEKAWGTKLSQPSAATPQPPPSGSGTVILDLVLVDLKARAEMGKKKYGTLLRAHNGRDALTDAYQEALDLVMYLRQKIEEDKA